MGYNYHTLDIPELSPHDNDQDHTVCQRPETPAVNHRYFESLQILNCKFEEVSISGFIDTSVTVRTTVSQVTWLLGMRRVVSREEWSSTTATTSITSTTAASLVSPPAACWRITCMTIPQWSSSPRALAFHKILIAYQFRATLRFKRSAAYNT